METKSQDIKVGSVWKVITRDHYGHKRKIVGTNASGTMVHVMFLGQASRQHKDQIYSVPKNVFLLHNELSKKA